MAEEKYTWTDNPTESGKAICDTDILNECLMHLKYNNKSGSGLEVCDIGTALYVDETKGLRRYLNGQIVDINTNTQAFLNRLLQIQATNPDYFTIESNWQTEATLNIDGCVYKFVLNYAGDTVVSVRLPKYPDYVEISAGGALPVVGNGMTLGLTDGTTNFGFQKFNDTANYECTTGAYGKSVGTTVNNANMGSIATVWKTLGVTTDPTKSGIETTLNQTKLKMRYFIQIATGSETENNIINTLENVNGFTLLESKYCDKPLYNEGWLLSNGQYNAKAVYPTVYEGLQVEYNSEIEAGITVTLPSSTKYTKRGLSVKLSTETYTDYDFVLNTADETFRLPLLDGSEDLLSDRYIDLEPLASESTYTAPANGYFFFNGSSTNANDVALVRDNATNMQVQARGGVNSYVRCFMPVSKGDTLMIGYTSGITVNHIRFIYTQGNGSLYYYVGNVSQNNGIINAGRIGEQLASKVDMQQATVASFPSSRYIDLTLGASGATYTAPANGYFQLAFLKGTAIQFYNLTRASFWKASTSANESFAENIECQAGDIIQCYYVYDLFRWFRFYYAEGSKEE